MMAGRFDKLSEAQIRKAQAEGQLDDLPGAGKPLPDRPEEIGMDIGTAVGHRIMAEAGALPEEITLRKTIVEAKRAYAEAASEDAQREAMKRLADLELKLAIATEARKKFLG